MPGRRARSPGLGLDKFEAQALGFPKLWSQLLGLGLGLACQGLRAQAYTSLLTDTDSDRMWHEWHDHECLSRVCLFITSVFVYRLIFKFFLFTTTIGTSSMPRNQIIDSDDDENTPESLPPPQRKSTKLQKDLSDNVQIPNRTRSSSERTLSAKQQAISKCFHHPISIG